MPATEGIDDEWGAAPDAVAQVIVPAPGEDPVIAQPKAERLPPRNRKPRRKSGKPEPKARAIHRADPAQRQHLAEPEPQGSTIAQPEPKDSTVAGKYSGAFG